MKKKLWLCRNIKEIGGGGYAIAYSIKPPIKTVGDNWYSSENGFILCTGWADEYKPSLIPGIKTLIRLGILPKVGYGECIGINTK